MKTTRADRIPEHMAPQKGHIRLFDNPILERLSKITPVTVLAVYTPVIIFAVWKSFSIGIPVGAFFALFFSGLAVWTLFEYMLSPLCFSLHTKRGLPEAGQFSFSRGPPSVPQ